MRLTFDTDRDVAQAFLGHLPMVARELGGIRLASSIGILEVHPANMDGQEAVAWRYTPMTSAETAATGTSIMSTARSPIARYAQRIMEVPGARLQRYRLGGDQVNGLTNGVPDDFTNAAYDHGVGYGDLTAQGANANEILEDEEWAFNGALGGLEGPATAGESRIGARSRSRSPKRTGTCPCDAAPRSRSPRRIVF